MNDNLNKINFNKAGLVPAIIQDFKTKEVLMLAYMSEQSYKKTLETGQTWFWSRSRQELWNKGAISGNYQVVKGIALDCDVDTLLIQVEQMGTGACHVGSWSCFTTVIPA